MDLTPLIIVVSSVAATLALLVAFATGWFAARSWGNASTTGAIGGRAFGDADAVIASRIGMADVRERLRRLEAIAAGVEL